jgi:hypothetical protein
MALGFCSLTFLVSAQSSGAQTSSEAADPAVQFEQARSGLQELLDAGGLQATQVELLQELLDVLSLDLFKAPTLEQTRFLELWLADAVTVFSAKQLTQIATMVPRILPLPPAGSPPPPGGPLAANCDCLPGQPPPCGGNLTCSTQLPCTQVPACGPAGNQPCTGRCLPSLGSAVPTLSAVSTCLFGMGLLVIGLMMLKRGAPGI